MERVVKIPSLNSPQHSSQVETIPGREDIREEVSHIGVCVGGVRGKKEGKGMGQLWGVVSSQPISRHLQFVIFNKMWHSRSDFRDLEKMGNNHVSVKYWPFKLWIKIAMIEIQPGPPAGKRRGRMSQTWSGQALIIGAGTSSMKLKTVGAGNNWSWNELYEDGRSSWSWNKLLQLKIVGAGTSPWSWNELNVAGNRWSQRWGWSWDWRKKN